MQALGRGAARVCTQHLCIHTGAAGARTLRAPFGPFLIFYPLQHTGYDEKDESYIH